MFSQIVFQFRCRFPEQNYEGRDRGDDDARQSLMSDVSGEPTQFIIHVSNWIVLEGSKRVSKVTEKNLFQHQSPKILLTGDVGDRT
ncbi:UNVERIFIED_CONTAM: hypothetical protein K2H54_012559 [Gekko kuhli]